MASAAEEPQGPIDDGITGPTKPYTGKPQPLLSGVTSSYGGHFGTLFELWFWADMLELTDADYLNLLEWRQGFANMESAQNKAWSDILRATKKVWISDSALASAKPVEGTAKDVPPKRLPKAMADVIADALKNNFAMFPGSELIGVEIHGSAVVAKFLVDGTLALLQIGSASDLLPDDEVSGIDRLFPGTSLDAASENIAAFPAESRQASPSQPGDAPGGEYDHDAFLQRHGVGNQIRKPTPDEIRPLPGNPGDGILEEALWVAFGDEGYDPFLPPELLPLQMLGAEGRLIDTILPPDPPIQQWDPEEGRYGSLTGDLNEFAHNLAAGIAVVTAVAGGLNALTAMRRSLQFELDELLTEAQLLDDLGIAPGSLAPVDEIVAVVPGNIDNVIPFVGNTPQLGSPIPPQVVQEALGSYDLVRPNGSLVTVDFAMAPGVPQALQREIAVHLANVQPVLAHPEFALSIETSAGRVTVSGENVPFLGEVSIRNVTGYNQ